MLFPLNMYAQHIFGAIIKDSKANPLPGATANIKLLNRSSIADSNGLVTISNVPTRKFEIIFSHVGLQKKIIFFQFPLTNDSIMGITLKTTFFSIFHFPFMLAIYVCCVIIFNH